MTLQRPVLMLLLFASHALALQPAQPPVRRVDHRVACITCRVEFTRIAVLGKDTDPALISRFSNIDRDSRGRFYAYSDYNEIIVFDPRGNFLRTVGRAGDGPGEFSTGTSLLARMSIPVIKKVVIGRGDSLFVYHEGRISVFTPDYVHVRTTMLPRFPAGGGAVYRLGDGSWLLGGELRRVSQNRVHQIGGDGVVRRSLGAKQDVDSAGRRVGEFVSSFFIMAPDEKTFWTTNERYTLEHWRMSDGAYQGKIEVRGAPWLLEPNYVMEPTRSGNPFRRSVGGGWANVGGIDSLGRLWITGRTYEGNPTTVEAMAKAKLTFRLEVFDPQSGAIRSSQITPDYMRLSPRADFAVSYAESTDGIPIIAAYSYRYVDR